MTKPAVSTTSGEQQVQKRDADTAHSAEAAARPAVTQILSGILPEVLLLGVAACLFYASLGFEGAPEPGQLGAAFWPQVLCIGLGLCAAGGIAQKLIGGRRETKPSAGEGEAGEEEPSVSPSRVAVGILLVVGYVLGMVFLGYILATILFFVAFAFLGGQRRWYVVPIGIAGSIALAFVFLKVVYVALPSGVGVFDQFSVLVYRFLGIY